MARFLAAIALFVVGVFALLFLLPQLTRPAPQPMFIPAQAGA